MAASLEVELKLQAGDEEPLRRLAAVEHLGRFSLGPASTVRELDRYLDTPDRRFAAAGWACRLRERGGSIRISLKGPAEHHAGDALHRRPELEGPAGEALDPGAWQPSAARDALSDLAAGQPLVERLALEQERTERTVFDGQPLGLLSLDRVAVRTLDRVRGRFLAVELELRPGSPGERLAGELLQALQAFGGLQLDPRSKLERALELLRPHS
ncbi:MAG TPA: CYTH domain-containing protein [Candidatus Limnocylindria bacterium]